MHAKNVLNIGPAVSQPLATGNKVTTLRPLWIFFNQAFANYAKLQNGKILERFCKRGSVLSLKISFQFQPGKFEIFQNWDRFNITKKKSNIVITSLTFFWWAHNFVF